MLLRRSALAGALALSLAGCVGTSLAPSSTTSTATTTVSSRTGVAPFSTTAGTTTPTRPVTKLLVFVVENHSLAQMKAQMPYTFDLARRFGHATNYTAVRYPSLPNYVAIAGGTTHGISDDGPPSANAVHGTSVFGQAVAAGRTAGLYAEGMPANCATENSNGSGYAVRHNPWAYFLDERDLCRRYDVPLEQLGPAIAGGTLPTVGMVVPNLCHDAHDCPLGVADEWFKTWMERVLAGPDWKSGQLAVVLTADEDDHSMGNTVLTVVIHPSQRGNVVTSPLTHYSLTRLYGEVAGTAYLHAAGSAPSIATAFGLPLQR